MHLQPSHSLISQESRSERACTTQSAPFTKARQRASSHLLFKSLLSQNPLCSGSQWECPMFQPRRASTAIFAFVPHWLGSKVSASIPSCLVVGVMHAGSFTVDSCLCCAMCLKHRAFYYLGSSLPWRMQVRLTCSIHSSPNSLVFLGKQGSSLVQIWGFLRFPGISGPTYTITIRLCIFYLCFLGLRLINLICDCIVSTNLHYLLNS